MNGGPGSLLIAYIVYSTLLGMVNNSMAEMAVYMPVSGSFIRMAGKWVDESFGFMAGWNFFLYEATLIPFEISALNLVLTFWSDDIPVAAVCAACIVLYAYVTPMTVLITSEEHTESDADSFVTVLSTYLQSSTMERQNSGSPVENCC